MNDEDSDLGCAMVSTNQCIQKIRLNDSSLGAGVNANSELVDMTFATSSPLSELVWSPDNGLRVKCTDISSLADKKLILLRNVGPSNQTSQSVGSEGIRDKIIVDEEDSTKSEAVLKVRNKFRVTSRGLSDESNGKMEEEAGTTDANCKQESSEDKENEDLCTSEDVQIAETSKENAVVVGEAENKLELSNENELGHMAAKKARDLDLDETRLSQETPLPIERFPTNSGIPLHQEKGKQKAFSDDSHESVESCNGTYLFTKGIKREICDQELVCGNKRMKNQIQGSYCTESPFGPDSSFMNWISNMVKGHSDSNKEEKSSSLARETSEKTHGSRNISTGFQTMFQALYSQNTKKTEVDIEDYSIEDNKTSVESLPRSCEGKTDNSLEMPICIKENGEESPCNTLFKPVNKTVIDTSLTSPLATSNTPQKSNPLSSLWITRLYNRVPNTENDNKITQKDNDSLEKPSVGLNSSSKPLRDDQNFLLCNYVNTQSRGVPAEMVNAVRKLRLSRYDILRWMNSSISLGHLNGFFVRLRLAKVETGLRGPGYYVACIKGDSREHIGCKSKKTIFVDVGGIKSSVASRYISNNDFLEDEIDVWWSRIVKSGGKIPSLDKLNAKYRERKALGF